MSPWRPILKGPVASRAWQFIDQLDKNLYSFEKKFLREHTYHFFWEAFGAGLFLRYLYSVSGEKAHLKRAQSFLNILFDTADQINNGDTLSSGFTSAAWLAEHFRRQSKNKRWQRGQDPNGDLDSYFISKIRKSLPRNRPLGKYGLVDEWIGYGVYALERWPHGKTSHLLNNLVEFLDKKAKRTPDGVAWYSTKDTMPEADPRNFSRGYFNLGVSHGNGGVIGFLAAALKLGIKPQLTKELLENSTRWLIAQDNGKPYGPFVPKSSSKIKTPKPRLAWCYGDLGLSMVLLNAARELNDSELKSKALVIAHRAGGLKGTRTGVVDPTFCHGACGAFHVFNRLYQDTGDLKFLDLSQKWAQKTFSFMDQPEWGTRSSINLYTGRAGIGLSLLAGLSKTTPDWDRVLLMSL